MPDEYAKYVGNWIKVNCTLFMCTGKIESINKNIIILSNASLSNAKLQTRFIGIDIHLITDMDFIQPVSIITKSDENVISNPVNVYTSDSKPPSIKRGGSSSAVNRNLSRQTSQENSKGKNSSFSDFGSARKNSTGNSSNEPEWLNFSMEEINTDFDFDKNLALFDKDSLFGTNKKSTHQENSDSSDSVCLITNVNHRSRPSNTNTGKPRCNTISIDSDDFSFHETEKTKSPTHLIPLSTTQNTISDSKHQAVKRDIFSEFKHIGIIPSSSGSSIKPIQNRIELVSGPEKLLQQPDLVREITQRQMKNGYKRQPNVRQSVITVQGTGHGFSEFSEFWNLENHNQFPVFSIKQRNILFEAAWQLGIDSKHVINTVGDALSDFIIAQVGGFTKINDANMHRAPKIAILLGKCMASVFAVSIAKFLLKRGCQLFILVEENKASSDTNYRIEYEIKMLNNLLLKTGNTAGYNFITYDVMVLANTSFDFIVSGFESDVTVNSPSDKLRYWVSQQQSHILCINPPRRSILRWTSGVFIGVPTFGPCNFFIDGMGEFDKHSGRDHRMPHMFLWNLQFPERVYSFLKLGYKCPFTVRHWVRLYGAEVGDLSLVE